MTVQDLIYELEQLDGDTEVRFASQPNWPFEYSIDEVLVTETDGRNDNGEEKEIVYLSEGRQLGYLPANVSEELGWR